jgi:hypothetical protein
LDLLDPKDFYIIWLSNLMIISVPVEGYSNLMIISVPVEGYSNRLIISVPVEGYSNRLIISVPVEGYSRNVSCALNLISTFVIIGTCMVIQRYIAALLF